MAMPATHRGHCQLCGALHKLPKGRLSTHGYTVAHGYFSGICRGTGALPFEQSFGLVLDEIETARVQLLHVQAFVDELRQPATADTLMWVRTHVKASFAGRAHYIWEPVTLHATLDMSEPEYPRMQYRYVAHGGVEVGDYRSGFHGVEFYDMPDATVEQRRLATIDKFNQIYAHWFDHETESLRRYIAWQRERVQNWKAAPLLPVDGKFTDESFKPTPAPY